PRLRVLSAHRAARRPAVDLHRLPRRPRCRAHHHRGRGVRRRDEWDRLSHLELVAALQHQSHALGAARARRARPRLVAAPRRAAEAARPLEALIIRVGLRLSQQVQPIAVQREAWRMADAAGFDHIWLFDHLVAIHQEPVQPIHDGWTLLGAMAEDTKRAHIGLNVTGNLYRHPGLLAKIAVTVDHLSKGRLEFGIGAARNEPEFKQQGLPFPSAADRIRMLDESIRAIKLLWSERRAT